MPSDKNRDRQKKEMRGRNGPWNTVPVRMVLKCTILLCCAGGARWREGREGWCYLWANKKVVKQEVGRTLNSENCMTEVIVCGEDVTSKSSRKYERLSRDWTFQVAYESA